MSETVIHSLLNKDPKTMTGDCSVCGLVAIAKSGRGFQCSVKKRANTRAWQERNQAKAAANRRRRSEHELFGRDYVKLRAQCSKCDTEVTMVAWGRGYACGNRATELRSTQERKPQQSCRECWLIDGSRVYLSADGSCPRCTDESLYSVSALLRETRHRSAGTAGMPDGFGVYDESFDPYDDDRQPAVPGWRTIGSERPWNEV